MTKDNGSVGEKRTLTDQEIPSHINMVMESIRSFSNDGRYSIEEIERVLLIALDDGQINDDEKRVLASVLEKAKSTPLNDEVKAYIASIEKLYF
ncbi:hypothetical protein [Pleionea sp. CnH1-48]|uniref:hypothetical protein n=1 Tax=Pleionea sp. CnH1-48 TaxID=2954494 RepID=UPI0020968E04|nr:hypothetical protein [Pleionea sp. CnH1-48]MCO7227084.1 hypothetical protein [Pleionea sp. CnH1-48]